MSEVRVLSRAVVVKRYSELDPFGRAEPTQAEYQEAMQKLAYELAEVASIHHVTGWKEDPDLDMRLVDSDDLKGVRLVTLRGYLRMRRGE
jgi:hypothetical protein